MPIFSAQSKAILATCHPDLIEVATSVIKRYDFTVLRGIRSIDEQKENVRRRWSTTMKSEHLPFILDDTIDPVSRAYDVAPYPLDWKVTPLFDDDPKEVMRVMKNRCRFHEMAGIFLATGWEKGIELRWGGDWDGDHDFTDQTFDDLGHLELRPTRDAYL